MLKGLAYGGFKPADDSYLDPMREMEAVRGAGRGAPARGDAAKIAAAQADFDKIHAAAAQKRAKEPDV